MVLFEAIEQSFIRIELLLNIGEKDSSIRSGRSIINCQPCRHETTRFEEQRLSHNYRRRILLDGSVKADDALFEKPGKDIAGTLATGCVLDDHRNQAVETAVG